MTYGTSLGVSVPAVGTAGTGYAATINATLTAMINRLQTKVTPAGMDISADLSYRSGSDYYGAKELHRVSLNSDSLLSAATYPNTLFVYAGDLYYNDVSGNQVRLTASGLVNVTGTGGITGSGYGSAGVEVNWDAANTRYKFLSGGGANDYAAITVDDVQFRDGSGNAVRLGSPAIASDYNYFLPTGLPGSTSLVQSTSGGQLQHTRDPVIDTLTLTGSFMYGSLSRVVNFLAFQSGAGGDWVFTSSGVTCSGGAGAGTVYFPLPVNVGERLLGATVFCSKDNTESVTYELKKVTSGGTVTTPGSGVTTSTGTGTGADSRGWSGLNITVTSGDSFYVVGTNTAPSANLDIRCITVAVDKVA